MKPKVENALAIRAFDYVAALCFGAVAALAAWFLVSDSLSPLLVMPLGMLVGMASALPLLAILSQVLGGFELLVLSMQVGMFAGMAGAMTGSATVFEVGSEGAMVGLMIQILLHVVDRYVGGEVTLDE
jgi:hypothetical protein